MEKIKNGSRLLKWVVAVVILVIGAPLLGLGLYAIRDIFSGLFAFIGN